MGTVLLDSRLSAIHTAEGAVDTFERDEYVRAMKSPSGARLWGLAVKEVTWVVTIGRREGRPHYKRLRFRSK